MGKSVCALLMIVLFSAGIAWAVLPVPKLAPKAKVQVKKNAAENPAVARIRAKYEAIRSLESKLVHAELDSAGGGDSSEGSKAEVYRERGVVKEVREEYFSEMGRLKYFMFYELGKAFFVLEEDTGYSIPFMEAMEGLPKPTKEMVESRFYIDGGRLIKYVEGKTEIAPATGKFKKRESEILDLTADALENAN